MSIRASEGEAGVMDESSSQIAMLMRVLREIEKEVEEFQHKLKDQSLPPSEVSVISECFLAMQMMLHYAELNVLQLHCMCHYMSETSKREQSSVHPGICCSIL